MAWKNKKLQYNPKRNPPGVDQQGKPVEPGQTQIELTELPEDVKRRLQELLDRQQAESQK